MILFGERDEYDKEYFGNLKQVATISNSYAMPNEIGVRLSRISLPSEFPSRSVGGLALNTRTLFFTIAAPWLLNMSDFAENRHPNGAVERC